MSRLFAAAVWLVALWAFVAPAASQDFETKAERAYLIDAETGAVLFSKNADEPFPPASLAKLMTVEMIFQALEEGRLSFSDTFFVSENAWRTGGAPSGEGFARMMTERARSLGLSQSTFANATGLPADGQKVTAREMTELAVHLWRSYPKHYHYFSQEAFEWNRIFQRNRNPLIRLNAGVDGLGIGYAEGFGYAITVSAARGGRRLFATLSGLASEEERVEETRKLLDWGFNAFEKRRIVGAGDIVGEVSVYGGERRSLGVRTEGSLSVLVPRGQPERISARIVYEGPVPAPVEQGARIGTLQIWIGDTLSQEEPVYAAQSMAQGTLRQRAIGAVRELLVGWMR